MIYRYTAELKDYKTTLNMVAGDNIISSLRGPSEKIKGLCKDKKFINHFSDALAEMIRLYDPVTGAHSWNTSRYSENIAKCMDLDEKLIQTIKLASLLQDIGKVSIPESVLNKKGKAQDYDWYCIKKHPDNSKDILSAYGFSDDICMIVSQHHERSDGSGYNSRLGKSQICLGAKIVSVADAYDAITSNRPYKKAKSKKSAFQILKSDSGFDQKIVEKLIASESIRQKSSCQNYLSRKNFLVHKSAGENRKRTGAIFVPSDPKIVKDAIDIILKDLVGKRKSLVGIEIAACEALFNGMVHGNFGLDRESDLIDTKISDDLYNKSLNIQYCISNEGIRFTIRDEGQGFDYRSVPDPSIKGNLLKDHGRGIFIMKHFADKVSFNDRGNEVSIEKRLSD
jgi:hypothetical protein